MSILSAFGFAQALSSPLVSQGLSELRYSLGWNDTARERNFLYAQQNRSVGLGVPLDPTSNSFSPVRLGVGQAITLYNQSAWHLAYNDPAMKDRLFRSLQLDLADNGVNIKDYEIPAGAAPQAEAALRWANGNAQRWQRLVDMSSTAAPLGSVIHDFYRSLSLPEAERTVNETELRYNLQRAQVRREEDRQRHLQPFFRWSATDFYRLFSVGAVNEEQLNELLKSVGMANQQDKTFARWLLSPLDVETVLAISRRDNTDPAELRKQLGLAGLVTLRAGDAALRLQWKHPGARDLMASAIRNAFDEQLVARYGLDQGVGTNPMIRYWMQAEGLVGPEGSPAPGAHDGPTDWMKYYWRGAHPLIGFETALELQYRLRPSAGDPAQSVVAGAPAWTGQNTLDSLRMAGYSDVQAKWLQGLTNQPINIRLINHILGPFAHHADVRAAADQAFGVGVDWVKGAMLDHGFSDAYATVAAAGIHAQAEDRNNEEMLAEQRSQRKQYRELVLKEYALGTANKNLVGASIVEDQFSEAMADEAMLLIDRGLEYELAASHLEAIKDGYMGGKLSLDQVSAQMTALNLTDQRKAHYIQAWTWKRNDNARMLSTGEILGSLKKGLLTPALALTRLTNLGWTQPDALVEIAQVEHDLAAVQQHQQTAAAAKAIADRLKQDRAAAAQAKTATAAREKIAKATLRAQAAGQRLPLEQQINLAKYDATALLDWVAYNKAVTAGDDTKAAAEIKKAEAAFGVALLNQLKLRQENPELAHEIQPVIEVVNPQAVASAGDSSPAASAAQQPGEPPAAGSGPGTTAGA